MSKHGALRPGRTAAAVCRPPRGRAFAQGYDEGYKTGRDHVDRQCYDEGYRDGWADCEKSYRNQGGERGYAEGYERGHIDGEREGYRAGQLEAHRRYESMGQVSGPCGPPQVETEDYDEGFEDGKRYYAARARSGSRRGCCMRSRLRCAGGRN